MMLWRICKGPRAGCRTSTRGLFLVKDNADDTRDKLIFKLTNAMATSQTRICFACGAGRGMAALVTLRSAKA